MEILLVLALITMTSLPSRVRRTSLDVLRLVGTHKACGEDEVVYRHGRAGGIACARVISVERNKSHDDCPEQMCGLDLIHQPTWLQISAPEADESLRLLPQMLTGALRPFE